MNGAMVARALRDAAALLEIEGANPFRCRAYRAAADSVERLGDEILERAVDGTLLEVPGVGNAIAEKIVRLVTAGSFPELDELKRRNPPGILELQRVPGLGPARLKALRETLGVASLDDLRAVVDDGRIAAVKGFGPKTIPPLRDALRFLRAAERRVLAHHADRAADRLARALADALGNRLARLEPAGELRRREETLARLEWLALPAPGVAPGDLLRAAARIPQLVDVRMDPNPDFDSDPRHRAEARLEHRDGLEVVLVVAPSPEALPALLCEATGPDTHLRALRERAAALGLPWPPPIDERTRAPDDLETRTLPDAPLYRALGLQPIPPELRHRAAPGSHLLDLAAEGRLPELATRADLRGTFHCHTDWSDGAASLREMAEAARAAGLRYLGIADHSRSAAYAGGLSVERVREQWRAVDALNAEYAGDFRILKGVESDVLADGSLDYPDDVLDQFDYVVASIHSGFRKPAEVQTERLRAALRRPACSILGHPAGRLLLAREGYPLDLPAVLDAAAEHGNAVEINADPHRLDLDAEHAALALQRGVPLAVNPDAHDVDGFRHLDRGVDVARRAGARAGDLLNARPLDEVEHWLRETRERRRARARARP